MRNKVLFALATLAMVAFLSSCGKLPQEKLDAAKAAIDSAKLAEADVYLAADFTALQDSLNAANTEIEAQKSKLFKKYGPVTQKLEWIITRANEVTAGVAAKKEEVKKEAEGLVTEITGLMDETQKLMKKAPRGKEGAAVLEQMKNELTTAEAALNEGKTQLEGGKYMDAVNKLKAAKETVTSVKTELENAIAKVKGKK